jgi:hypothetical protein
MSTQLDALTQRVFRRVATVRGAPALHPTGVTTKGHATLLPGQGDASVRLAERSRVDVIVRFSRGVGLPSGLPDFNGIAIRFVDAHGTERHQDLLLTSAGSWPLLRHVLLPARRLSARSCSSVLPYRTSSRRSIVFRCSPPPASTLDAITSALPFDLQLQCATAFGRWRDVARVRIDEVEHDLIIRFDPWNTSGGLTPAGLVNRLRRPAYAGSRAGSPTH